MAAAQPFDFPNRRGLIQGVVEILRRHITDGSWPVGARIPTEPELTQLTGVGRNTVREAVQSLVHAGLIERRQGSGTYVLATNEVVVMLSRAAEAEDATVTANWEAFVAVWGQAAELAATRRSTEMAENLNEATIDLIGDPAALVTNENSLGALAPQRIHPLVQAVFDAAESPLIRDIATGVLMGLATHATPMVAAQSLLDVARAIVNGDAAAAGKAARATALHINEQY